MPCEPHLYNILRRYSQGRRIWGGSFCEEWGIEARSAIISERKSDLRADLLTCAVQNLLLNNYDFKNIVLNIQNYIPVSLLYLIMRTSLRKLFMHSNLPRYYIYVYVCVCVCVYAFKSHI